MFVKLLHDVLVTSKLVPAPVVVPDVTELPTPHEIKFPSLCESCTVNVLIVKAKHSIDATLEPNILSYVIVDSVIDTFEKFSISIQLQLKLPPIIDTVSGRTIL